MQLTVKGWAFSSKMSKERTSLSLKGNLKTFQNFPININFVLTKVIKNSYLNFQKFYQLNGIIFFSLLRHNNHTNKFILKKIFKIFPTFTMPSKHISIFFFLWFQKKFSLNISCHSILGSKCQKVFVTQKVPMIKNILTEIIFNPATVYNFTLFNI